jgi:hypothetical protein
MRHLESDVVNIFQCVVLEIQKIKFCLFHQILFYFNFKSMRFTTWHVDDLKLSHMEEDQVTQMIVWMESIYTFNYETQ